jgi:ferritin-like metal-binding protein YciE
MKLKNLHDLYVSELKDIYNAETQILNALPKMAKAARSENLRAAFEEHAAVTQQQKERLEEIFKSLDTTPKGKKCKGMEGLVEEGKEYLDADAEDAVHDAALIAAAQRIEHYEIAVYGTVRTYAQMLGYDEAAKLLQATLDEESATDEALSRLAETEVNVHAVEASQEK